MSTYPAAADFLPEVTQCIVKSHQPLRTIVFGSQTRGDADADSDLDLVVVLPRVDDRHGATVSIMRSLRDLPISVDVIVTSSEELERRGNQLGSVLRTALAEGEVVYEQRPLRKLHQRGWE